MICYAHRWRAVLVRAGQSDYATHVPEKEGTRGGSLKTVERTGRASGFVSCACLRASQWSGDGCGSLRARWFRFAVPVFQPAVCRSPRLEAGLRCDHYSKEAHMPNRSRTSIPPAVQAAPTARTAEQAKNQALRDAHFQGRERGARWAQLDPVMRLARPRAVWRAIGYADAVICLEHEPLFVELMQEWERGFDSAFPAAEPTIATTNQASTPPSMPAAPLHTPFSWLHPSLVAEQHAEFVALTRDVCHGARLCQQIAFQDRIDAACEGLPLMSSNDQDRLALLATRSLEMLGQMAEAEIERLNDLAEKGGAA